MSKSAILVDTGCAPTKELLNRPDVFMMGMHIHLDKKEFIDGETLDSADYYGTIDKIKDFSSSPPKVWDIKKKYEEIRRKGYDSVLSIHVSSKMSKLIYTCENAKNLVGGLNIDIIDTKNISIGGFFVMEKVVELAQSGRSVDEIRQLLPEIYKSTYFQISLTTLKYLVKNKRVGRVQGMVGNLLKVKPILGLDEDGYLTTLSKERGGERVIKKIVENAISFLENNRHNVKIYFSWGFDENKLHVNQVYRQFMVEFQKLGIKDYTVHKSRMWPTVACNSGPGAYGFGTYGEQHPIA